MKLYRDGGTNFCSMRKRMIRFVERNLNAAGKYDYDAHGSIDTTTIGRAKIRQGVRTAINTKDTGTTYSDNAYISS
jgi:hypothetical protein